MTMIVGCRLGAWPAVGVAAALLGVLVPAMASAQTRAHAPGMMAFGAQAQAQPLSSPNGAGLFSPPDVRLIPPAPIPEAGAPPPQTLAPPAVIVPPAPQGPTTSSSIPPGHIGLAVSARYGRESPQPITAGLLWRIYPVKPDANGAFRPLREDKSPAPVFALPPGDYVVHVTFGLASAAKAVRLRSEAVREVFDLPAGGLRLEGRVGDVRIPAAQIAFDIFPGSQFDPGEKRPLVQGVMTGDVVVLPEGVYHIVSNYGDSNSVVRSDIRVQAGKLTDVTVTHRAAVMMLKLVTERGGEALANTSWLVETPSGDVIKEAMGAFPRIVLAEGEYRVIARNDGKTYHRMFRVITGVDGEVEVLAR